MKKYLFKNLIIICAGCFVLISQTTEKNNFQNQNLIEAQEKLRTQNQQTLTEKIALDGPIDPSKYYVGPTDVIAINLWLSPSISYTLTVTPEGTIIIPTFGEIKITDLTLQEAKNKIKQKILKGQYKGDISVTLLVPRQIVVTVNGFVPSPGKFTVRSTDKVEGVIDLGNDLRSEDLQDEITVKTKRNIRNEQSKRNIILTRDSSKIRIDLQMYNATKDEKYNPYLREGDEVFVAKSDPQKNFFAIYGGINLPGQYELIDGDKIEDAIKLAYGLTKSADLENVTLYRYDKNQKNLISKNLNLRLAEIKNITLESGDRIIVKEKIDLKRNYFSTILGEVNFPGTYPISFDSTYLSEIVEIAGGFTTNASLNISYLQRSFEKRNNINQLPNQKTSDLINDSIYARLENELLQKRELVSVNFAKIFKDKSEDVILKPNDTIYVSSKKQAVYLYGQVLKPGYYGFESNKDISFYLQKAGGVTELSAEEIMIFKPASNQWLKPNETKIEGGDYIWVPMKKQKDVTYYLSSVGQVAGIISTLLTLYLITLSR